MGWDQIWSEQREDRVSFRFGGAWLLTITGSATNEALVKFDVANAAR
jgi:hypothetical protein